MMNASATQQIETNSFPTWLYESRVTAHDWATTNVAVVYSYMLARYRFHAKNKRKFFESYECIAKATRLSIRTVKTAVKLLHEHKHLSYTKQKSAIGSNNIYIVHNLYGTWAPGFDEFPNGKSMREKDKAFKKPNESTKQRTAQSNDDEDLNDSPF